MDRKLIHGFGINDADYPISKTVCGNRVRCKIYTMWINMLQRCYSEPAREKYKSYRGCFVCDDWRLFTKFKSWVQQNEWQGNELDKDLLYTGNKEYSPEKCVFISGVVNNFMTDRSLHRGNYPIGVTVASGKFIARCRNPFTGMREDLGLFDCENEAHNRWKIRKHELACQLADLQSDARVAAALRVRYV